MAERFERGEIHGPVHLSGGNEEQLIRIFEQISREDWVFCSYRQHYHALLHGIPREKVMAEIMAGHSMTMNLPEHRFFSTAIVGGQFPVAVGVAWGMKCRAENRMVWCFCGDMAATTGDFHKASKYAVGHDLPIRFVIEDNGLSCETPTEECCGTHTGGDPILRYRYTRKWPHYGVRKYVTF